VRPDIQIALEGAPHDFEIGENQESDPARSLDRRTVWRPLENDWIKRSPNAYHINSFLPRPGGRNDKITPNSATVRSRQITHSDDGA
jgi:hypothetical protein